MKKMLVSSIIILAVICVMAAEKKSLKDVDIDEFTSDTQVWPKGAGVDHMAFVWWIPNEYWDSCLARDMTMSETDKKAMLEAMSGVSLLAVVQADITSFGAFKFYSKEEIDENMLISYTDAEDKQLRLSQVQMINPDLEIVLAVFKPILSAAMGNMGTNMHFYVLNDKSNSSDRLLDPYRKGLINIQLAKKNDDRMTADIEMPLNSLFVPRKCPNGKDAHISWNYCPWTGKRLED